MLKIHQPYKSKFLFAFVSIGVLLLGGFVVVNLSSETSTVHAAGDSRTIHDISNMQEMTQQICSNTDENDTAVLTDNRDGYSTGTMTGSDGSTHSLNQYVVVKLKDGNCWMQENMRLPGGAKLTSGDSDVNSNWTLPASATSWDVQNYQSVQMKDGVPDMAVASGIEAGNNKGWQPNYGNYYSWCAATAESCKANRTGGAITNGRATESICPKSWHLPTASTTGEFYSILNGLNFTTVQQNPYNFPAAGRIYTNARLYYPGTYGFYWSSVPSSISDNAYHLAFASSYFDPGTSNESRYYGFPVRCVASGGLEKIEKPTWSESKDGDVTVTTPSVISIDAASGMDKTADAVKVIEGTATATISSNAEYNISIHSTQPSLKDPKVSSAEISPVSESNPVKPGNNAWGLWDGSGDAENKSYTLPITNTPQDLYNAKETVTNTEGNPAKKHTYYVGISISPALPSGIYATDVIITASAK